MSRGKQSRSTSFDAELNGSDVCIEFDRITTWSSGMEGQDADGNRGVWMTMIDEDYAEGILVLTWSGPDGHKETVTPLAELPEADSVVIQALIDKYLEEHEPVVEEDDYDGPDNEADLDPVECDEHDE